MPAKKPLSVRKEGLEDGKDFELSEEIDTFPDELGSGTFDLFDKKGESNETSYSSQIISYPMN